MKGIPESNLLHSLHSNNEHATCLAAWDPSRKGAMAEGSSSSLRSVVTAAVTATAASFAASTTVTTSGCWPRPCASTGWSDGWPGRSALRHRRDVSTRPSCRPRRTCRPPRPRRGRTGRSVDDRVSRNRAPHHGVGRGPHAVLRRGARNNGVFRATWMLSDG